MCPVCSSPLPTALHCASAISSSPLPTVLCCASTISSIFLSRLATEHPKFLHIAGPLLRFQLAHLSLSLARRQRTANPCQSSNLQSYLSFSRSATVRSKFLHIAGNPSKQHPLAVASAAPSLSTTPHVSRR